MKPGWELEMQTTKHHKRCIEWHDANYPDINYWIPKEDYDVLLDDVKKLDTILLNYSLETSVCIAKTDFLKGHKEGFNKGIETARKELLKLLDGKRTKEVDKNVK